MPTTFRYYEMSDISGISGDTDFATTNGGFGSFGTTFNLSGNAKSVTVQDADGTFDGTSDSDQVVTSSTGTLSSGQTIELDYFYVVRDQTTGQDVGRIYFFDDGAGGPRLGFVTTFEVDPAHRYEIRAGGIKNPDEAYSSIPCFTSGSLIRTARGMVPVEQIKEGDLVLTRDRGMQPVRWVGRRHLTGLDLAQRPWLQPIRIARGALGNGLPKQDLCVSPQHRMMVRSAIAERMFGADEILMPTKDLLPLPGVTQETCGSVTYHHLLFDQHEVIEANGAATESLLTGTEALNSLGAEAVREIATLFPEVATGIAPVAARALARGRRARRMVQRHIANAKPLMAA